LRRAVRFFDVQRWTETPEGDRSHRLCKGYRRIFSRFEKLDATFLGFLTFVLVTAISSGGVVHRR